MRSDSLTPKQEGFALAYIETGNAREAGTKKPRVSFEGGASLSSCSRPATRRHEAP